MNLEYQPSLKIISVNSISFQLCIKTSPFYRANFSLSGYRDHKDKPASSSTVNSSSTSSTDGTDADSHPKPGGYLKVWHNPTIIHGLCDREDCNK